MIVADQSNIRNALLRAMAATDFARIAPDLRTRSLELRHHLGAPDEAIKQVTFPQSCTVSVVASTATGRQAEVGLIGCDGVVGIPVILANDSSPLDFFVQIPGDALQMPLSAFRRALADLPDFRTLCLRYAHNFLVQVSHAALAYSAFTVVERLARWLLMSHDRIFCDDIVVTHEFLAVMLGVRRAGVTIALNDVERRGFIATRRGQVTILDRAGLESIAADSYGVPERDYRRQLGVEPPRNTA